MSTKPPNECRESFEAWAGIYPSPDRIELGANLHAQWLAWQASWNSRTHPTPDRGLIEKLEQKADYWTVGDGNSDEPVVRLSDAIHIVRQQQTEEKVIAAMNAEPIPVPSDKEGYWKWLKEGNRNEVRYIAEEDLRQKVINKLVWLNADKVASIGAMVDGVFEELIPFLNIGQPEPVSSGYHMPDGRPIFGEGSPHDIGEHLEKVCAGQPVELSRIEQLLCVADDCRSLIEAGLQRDALFSIEAIKQLLIALGKSPERESVTHRGAT